MNKIDTCGTSCPQPVLMTKKALESGALKFDSKMKKINIPCSLQPVPRKLSSSCGICAKISYDGNIEKLISDEIQNIYYESSKNQYKLVFKDHVD